MTESPEPDDPDYSAWVTRCETVQDVASRSAATGLAALLDHQFDAESIEANPLFPLGHWLQFTPTTPTRDLGPDGHPTLGGHMRPLWPPRRMWAGGTIIFHSPIRIGQRLTRTTTIESITQKTGSTGSLCFVVLRQDVSADGEAALTEHQTIVYREAVVVDPNEPSPRRPPRPDGPTPEGWDWTRPLRPDEVSLFRYSALTFNSHRIHYDLPYATGVEGYPGLVVQGPLSATHIIDSFLRTHPQAELNSVEFSARAPLFVREQAHVAGRASGSGVEELALIGPDGRPAVNARIEYR